MMAATGWPFDLAIQVATSFEILGHECQPSPGDVGEAQAHTPSREPQRFMLLLC